MPDKHVAVALSGGVDSAVAAAFLKEKGFRVTGVTMEPWLASKRGEVQDAAKIAGHLGIAHHVVSFRDAFKKEVIDYLVAEYAGGRTPNPCAVCNPLIKFGGLLRFCDQIGAGKLATGHYAVVDRDAVSGRMLLKRGREHGKDQSYFLARLSQDVLERVLFPVGVYPKRRIRELADGFGIHVAGKSESQEACFIPEGELVSFIKQESGRDFPAGEIVDTGGNQLGGHQGIIGYTIGQRKGLGIALGRPAYVVRIESEANRLVVGDNEDLYRDRLRAVDPNWIALDRLDGPVQADVRIRYMHRPSPATVRPLPDGSVEVVFSDRQRAITPGQLAVFYDRDIVLGSAWIDTVPR
ncbi:tRNA 2-thiouridine(34) synthase MnmA [bacterium]|nr:tRNA 2-thiouridine(34) synthase MnmA [bacterium]